MFLLVVVKAEDGAEEDRVVREFKEACNRCLEVLTTLATARNVFHRLADRVYGRAAAKTVTVLFFVFVLASVTWLTWCGLNFE